MFRFVTLSTSPSAPQFRTKSARSDMKTNAKQNMRWIQNDSIMRSTGSWTLNYRLIFLQDKCETKYDSVCRDVQVFCQNFLQIEADCFRLQDTQCQTFEETKCDKELTVEYLFIFYFFSLQLFSVIRCTRTSAPWPTKRNTRRSAPPSRSRSVRHGPLGNWNKPVMTLTLHFQNDFIVSISNPWSQTKYDTVTETKCETQYETVYDEQCAPGIVLASEISSSWHWHFSGRDCLRQQVRKSLRDSLRGIKWIMFCIIALHCPFSIFAGKV